MSKHETTDLVDAALALQLDKQVLIEKKQWVHKVLEFSSQYGEGKGNWGAANICGPSVVYPKYADDVNAWAPQGMNCKDFLVFEYKEACVPRKFEVFETSAPGALVKISGKTPNGDWVELWSGERDPTASGKSRIFVPPLKIAEFPMSIFRFDTDATGWSAWYEIDAIQLTGDVAHNPQPAIELPPPKTLAGDLLALLQSQTGDITFETTDGEELKAHSAIVLARCPDMLKSRSQPINIGESAEVLKCVLLYVYTDNAHIAGHLSIAVHVAAKRFGLDHLAHAAAKRFVSGLNGDNIFQALRVVDGIVELRTACAQYLVNHPHLLLGNRIQDLSPSQTTEIVAIFAQKATSSPSSSS